MYLPIPVPTVSARPVDGKEHNVFQLRHLHHKLPGKTTFLFHPLQEYRGKIIGIAQLEHHYRSGYGVTHRAFRAPLQEMNMAVRLNDVLSNLQIVSCIVCEYCHYLKSRAPAQIAISDIMSTAYSSVSEFFLSLANEDQCIGPTKSNEPYGLRSQ
jgi:hypothetical protein